ncbi:MAG: hypothetical protein R3E54_14095 [Halioglobus sp.]
MSAKDLNLSLDRKLAHAGAPGKDKTAGVLKRGRFARLKPVPNLSAEGQQAPSRRPTPTGTAVAGSAASQWLAPALIALVNMLFLLLAGIWLTGTQYSPLTSRAPADATLEAPEAPALTRLQTQLDVMQEQLLTLQATLEEQQRLLLFSRLEAELAAEQGDASPGDASPGAAVSPPASPPGWQIHLGHFATREAAVTLQNDLRRLGYNADIAASTTPDDSGVSLLLKGFSERKLAELTAKDIMQSTRLNGLWVSTED